MLLFAVFLVCGCDGGNSSRNQGTAVDTSQFPRKEEMTAQRQQIDQLAGLVDRSFKKSEKENSELREAVKALAAKIERHEMVISQLTNSFSEYTNTFNSLVNYLGNELARHQTSISNLAWEVVMLNFKTSDTSSEATFDASDATGFQRINTSSGFFLVSFKNAEPYLDGYKVTLEIGNPLSATYDGLKFNLTWGKKYNAKDYDNAGDGYSKWQAGLKKKEVSILEKLMPGSWNRVSLVMSPAKSDELSYIKVKLSSDTLSLRKASEN